MTTKSANKFDSFCKRQLKQIRSGGSGIFFHKIRKSFELLFLSIFAPPAVYWKLNWPQAYYFVGNQYLKKYKQAFSKYTGDQKLLQEIEQIEDKAIFCLERYIARKPVLSTLLDWINANMALFHLLIHRNKYEEGMPRQTADIVLEVLKDHQFEKLDIEFVPRAFAMGNIGVYENLAVYVKAGLLGMRPSKKLVLLVDPQAKINNPSYLKYWLKYVSVITDPSLIKALSPLEKSLTAPLAFYMSFNNKRTLSSPFALGVVREKWEAEKGGAIFTISDEDYQRGWQSLKHCGVPQDAWLVCLHVRESGWNDHSASENFRNSDIRTYLSAIEAVVAAGGWVIRMGDPTMTPLPKMDHVIDYAHSNMKSDWMDVFLCSQCRFVIGTSSGLYTIALAFGAPVVMTNLLPAAVMYQLSPRDIFIPRICRSKNENRDLRFDELLPPPFGRAFSQRHYDSLGIEVLANTADEIKDAVVEMLERFNGTLQYSEEDECLQQQFKSLAAGYGKAYGDPEIAVNARIGKNFLKKYVELLPAIKQEKLLRS